MMIEALPPTQRTAQIFSAFRELSFMIDLRKLSFGSPAAITTSMGLIVGLGSATALKSTIITSLLIIGIADNLTDFTERLYLSRVGETAWAGRVPHDRIKFLRKVIGDEHLHSRPSAAAVKRSVRSLIVAGQS